jgi:ATP-binding cassette subfamily F protein 3
MILSCNKLCKSFITDNILDNVSFQLNEGEKVAIVGINGAGKSTLFKLISGDMEPNSGDIIINNQKTLGYLSQQPDISSDNTIYEEILSVKKDLINMEKELYNLELEISQNHDNSDYLNTLNSKYSNLRNEFELKDGYSYKSLVKGVLHGLGFTDSDFNKKTSILSGGQKTRLCLAKLLVSSPDILLLDEPTNHLDINSIEWLETFLLNYQGTLMIISHDRYFLDKIVTKVIELEHGRSKQYNGNFTFYMKHKKINEEIELQHYENQQKEIKKQEEVIKVLRSFNREKSIKRANSREKLLSKIDRLEKPEYLNDSINLTFNPKISSGNDVLKIRALKKSFENLTLFEDLDIDIFKGEKVALIGDNGTGKSTIFKLLTNIINPDSGTIKLGSNVNIGYFDQEHESLNKNNTLIEEISDTYPNMNNTDIRNTLASFLFTGDDVFKKISSLSGGEKGRLSLAKLMLSKANFLLLDEPTNHLDIVSKDILETALKGYTGTLLFISHDRYFINQISTRVLELTKGGLNNYIGDYDYYINKKKEQNDILIANDQSNKNTTSKDDWLKKKEEESMKRKIKNNIKKAEEKIHSVETSIEDIDKSLCLEEIYTDHEKVSELHEKKVKLELELEELYAEWENLISL